MKDYKDEIGKVKGVLTITDIVYIHPNQKHVKVKARCSRCGEEDIYYLEMFNKKAPYAEHFCRKCKDDYIYSPYKGLTNGVLTCLEVLPIGPDKRRKAKCLCSNCGNTTIVRFERLYKNQGYSPQSCEHCYKDIHRKITLHRYEKLHNLTGQEYKTDLKNRKKLHSYKTNAVARGYKFELSDEYAFKLFHSNCYYCGELDNMNGIDRLDSKKDYTEDNCVPCCGVCNLMKNKFSKEVFLDKISSIYNNLIMKSSTTIENTSENDGSE